MSILSVASIAVRRPLVPGPSGLGAGRRSVAALFGGDPPVDDDQLTAIRLIQRHAVWAALPRRWRRRQPLRESSSG